LAIRRSSKLKDLGDLKDELRQRARAALPAMCEQLGTAPFEPSKFELELVAHGDGAFFTRDQRHIGVLSLMVSARGPTGRLPVGPI